MKYTEEEYNEILSVYKKDYQGALDILAEGKFDPKYEYLKNQAVSDFQSLINNMNRFREQEYLNALEVLEDYNKELPEEYSWAIDKLNDLVYQYKMRLCDAELLNKLRTMTGTEGDMPLLNRVKELLENENK